MPIPRELFKQSKRGITLGVKVVPRASRLMIEGPENGLLKVRLTASPTDGQANEQLISLLAREMGIPKSSVRILRGDTSRTKILEFDCELPEAD